MLVTLERILDLRTLHPNEQLDRALEALHRLREDESVTLVFDHSPRVAYYLLAVERPELFAWTPLENGPLAWRVRVTGRPPRCLETCAESLLERDSAELRLLAAFLREDLEAACQNRSQEAGPLRSLLARLQTLAARFLTLQEDHFLPTVELTNPALECGPGRILRLQLDELPNLLTHIENLLATEPPTTHALDTASETLRELDLLLDDLTRRERQSYFPIAREQVSREEQERLVQHLKLRG